MQQPQAAPSGVRYCEILNCTDPAESFSRCGRHSDIRSGSNGIFNNQSHRSLFSSAYETNGIARLTAKRTGTPRFTLKSHPAPSIGSPASNQLTQRHGLSAPAVAYPLGGVNDVSSPDNVHRSPASSMVTPLSQVVHSGRTHRVSILDPGQSVSKPGLRAPLMQPSPSWNGSSYSDTTTSSSTEERRLQHATSYRSPASQEPTPKECWPRLRPEAPPTTPKSIPNLAPTAFLERAIGSYDSYLTKSHVTNGSGGTSSGSFSIHTPVQNPNAVTPAQHHLLEQRQLEIQQREQQVLEQRMREQQLRERQFREQQRIQRQDAQRLREQELHEQRSRQHREWAEKQAEQQQKEWQRLQQEKEKFHEQRPAPLQEPISPDLGSCNVSVSTPSVESSVTDQKPGRAVNGHGKRPAPIDDVVSTGTPPSPARAFAAQTRPQPVSTFDSDAFDAMIYRTSGGTAPLPDERDLVLWLPLNPAIHRIHNHSEAWYKAKAQEIKSRPRRKAWFGKVGARIHWLRTQKRIRSRMHETAKQSGAKPPRPEPEPVGFNRVADFGLIKSTSLPEDVQENAAWSAACAWHRQSKDERNRTQLGMQDASTLAWNMYKQLVEDEEASV